MTISKRDAKLLLILLGIVFLFVGYFAVYRPYTEKFEAAVSQTEAMEPELAELQGYYDNLDAYYAGIESAASVIDVEINKYAESVRDEDMIMYAIELRDKVGMIIDTISFAETVTLAPIKRIATDDKGNSVIEDATAYKAQMALTGAVSYAELKKLADYIAETGHHTTLESVSVSYAAETGELNGSAVVAKYFISSGNEEYVPTSVPNVPLGTDELFGSYEIVPPALGEGGGEVVQ